MELQIDREPSVDGATIGHLSIDGRFAMFTLEDVTRAPGVKIYGETAIPAGRYKVIVNKSQRFGRMLPLVIGVENFTGIRIHSGNVSGDTSGCILVGLARHVGSPEILSSRAALEILMKQLANAIARGEEVHLTIQNALAEEKRLA